MLVFKLSWLPYILILAGILVAAEGQPAALILCVIGGVWLYFRFKNKKAEKSSSNPNTPNAPYNPNTQNTSYNPNTQNTSYNPNTSSAPYATTNVPHATHIVSESATPADANKTAAKFCSNCGAKANPGSSFCSNCGNKL